MFRTILSALAVLVGLSYSLCAHAALNGYFDFTSNYIWRGITLSNDEPAVQGYLGYNFDNGIYVGVWSSNVDFNNGFSDGVATPTVNFEMEYGGGYRYEFTPDFNIELGIARSVYPASGAYDYNEAHIALNYHILNAGVAYSNNIYNLGYTGIYYYGGVKYEIPIQYVFGVEEVAINAHVGYYSLPAGAGGSYAETLLGISKQYQAVNISVAWTNTSNADSTVSVGGNHIVGTVTAGFG